MTYVDYFGMVILLMCLLRYVLSYSGHLTDIVICVTLDWPTSDMSAYLVYDHACDSYAYWTWIWYGDMMEQTWIICRILDLIWTFSTSQGMSSLRPMWPFRDIVVVYFCISGSYKFMFIFMFMFWWLARGCTYFSLDECGDTTNRWNNKGGREENQG